MMQNTRYRSRKSGRICGAGAGRGAARIAVLAAAIASATALPAAAQQSVTVRAGEHQDYGRIVFDWGKEVGFETSSSGLTARIRFSEALSADFDPVLETLSDYLSGATLDADGQTVILSLEQPVRIEGFRSGNAVAIDLRLADGEGGNGGQDPATGALETVGVRVGEHPTYHRIVFDWTGDTPYSADLSDGVLTMRFDRAARVDVAELASRLPDGMGAPQARSADGQLVVQIPVPGGSAVRDFVSGEKVVFDVTMGDGALGTIAAAAIGPDPADARPEAAPDPQDLAQDEPVPPAEEPPAEKPVAEAEPEPAPEPAPEQDEDVAADPGAEGEPAEDQAAVAQAEDEPQAAPEPETETQTADDAASEPPLDLRVRGAEEEVGPPTEAAQAVEQAIDDGTIQFKRDESGRPQTPEGPAPVSFSFDWPDPVGAAVFRRGDHIWIVFDQEAPLDLAPLRQQGAPLLDRIEQLPVNGATVIRMLAEPGINPIVSLEGFNWVVDFRDGAYPVANQAEIRAEADADQGPRLLFPTANPGALINMIDPDVGDAIQVATYRDPSVGVAGRRDYPEFSLLETAQGIALVPFGDDVLFERSFDGFAVSSPEGLHISAVSPAAPVSSGRSFSARRLFNMAEWLRGGPARYNAAEADLLNTVTEVPPENRNQARLDLARFYLAHGRGPEAKGVLRVVEGADENVFKNTELRALRGAVAFLNNDLDAAREDLSDPRLNSFAEVALWRGAALAEAGDWRRSAEQFAAGDSILRDYPYPLKGRLGLLRVEAALATRDLRAAKSWLDELDNAADQLRRGEYGDLRYHQGRIAMTRNDLTLARELWSELIESDDRKNAARAEFALLNMERRQGEISDEEVIERLERLRYRWRGDRFELVVLRRLGQIYIDNRDYFKALDAWRMAVTYFAEDPVAEEVAQDMTELFRRLYIEDEADDMPPLRALALYDEFRELTPAGAEGDLVIEKLADRLVAVDLLDRAASVLDYQAEFRLQGSERARIGAKLAYIQLLDNNPVGAIDALNKTAFPQLEQALENDRRRLRAKANHELNREEEAIKLLAGDTGREADMLRQDIFREMRNWTEAAKVLQRLAGDPPPAGEELGDAAARHVVNWAVALKLDGDEAGVDQVRDLYGPAMNLSALRDVFNYIVDAREQRAGDLEANLRQLADGDGFNAFMDNYRERMLSPKLGPDGTPPVTSGTNNLQG